MARATVLNRFEQPDKSGDNKLILDGTVKGGGGAIFGNNLISLEIGDISTAGTLFVSPGINTTIVKISVAIDEPLTAGTAGLTFLIDDIEIPNSAISIPFSGTQQGTVAQSITDQAIAIGQKGIEIVKDGLSTGTSGAVVTFELTQSLQEDIEEVN